MSEEDENAIRERVKFLIAGVRFGSTPSYIAIVEIMTMLRTQKPMKNSKRDYLTAKAEGVR